MLSKGWLEEEGCARSLVHLFLEIFLGTRKKIFVPARQGFVYKLASMQTAKRRTGDSS